MSMQAGAPGEARGVRLGRGPSDNPEEPGDPEMGGRHGRRTQPVTKLFSFRGRTVSMTARLRGARESKRPGEVKEGCVSSNA